MTAQIGDLLFYQGERLTMCNAPLGAYFRLGGAYPEFEPSSTALIRGYVATWELLDGRLYLIAIQGWLSDGADASLESVFPGYPERVFAHWYSGRIRVPRGKLLKYVHAGYASVYERDLLLDFERGVLVASTEKHNGVSDNPDAPEGYGVGALTVFSRPGTQQETDD